MRELDSKGLTLWSDVDIEVCTKLVNENEKSYTDFLTHLNSTDLDKVISYKNSTGKEFKNSVRDILIHVALHGQYHRGQINTRLRADGMDPVNTDFITFVR